LFIPGLGGSNEWESAKIDELNDGVMDVWTEFVYPWFGAADEEAKKQVVAEFENGEFKTMLERYDKFLAANSTGYFVGSKVMIFLVWKNFVAKTVLYGPTTQKNKQLKTQKIKIIIFSFLFVFNLERISG